MTKEQLIKEFREVTDKFVKHAGEWHDEFCYFPTVDEAVCNCNLPKNKRLIEAFLLSAFDAGRASGIEEVKEKIRKLIDTLNGGNILLGMEAEISKNALHMLLSSLTPSSSKDN